MAARHAYHVIVPTTAGPIAVRDLEPRTDMPTSAVFESHGYVTLPMSADYDAFAGPDGPVGALIGREAAAVRFRLELQSAIDFGRSWEFPLLLLHVLQARGETLEADPARADVVVWATGGLVFERKQPLARQRFASTDHHLVEKVERSADHLRDLGRGGKRILALLPEGVGAREAADRLAVLLDGFDHEVVRCEGVGDALAPLDRAPQGATEPADATASTGAVAVAAATAVEPPPVPTAPVPTMVAHAARSRSGTRRWTGILAGLVLAGGVVGAGGAFGPGLLGSVVPGPDVPERRTVPQAPGTAQPESPAIYAPAAHGATETAAAPPTPAPTVPTRTPPTGSGETAARALVPDPVTTIAEPDPAPPLAAVPVVGEIRADPPGGCYALAMTGRGARRESPRFDPATRSFASSTEGLCGLEIGAPAGARITVVAPAGRGPAKWRRTDLPGGGIRVGLPSEVWDGGGETYVYSIAVSDPTGATVDYRYALQP